MGISMNTQKNSTIISIVVGGNRDTNLGSGPASQGGTEANAAAQDWIRGC